MDWVHLHLALNHLPVIGIPFGLVVVLFGWWRSQRPVLKLGLWLLLLTTAAGIAIKFTGDEAASALNRPEDSFIQRHEESADQATTAVFTLLVVTSLALFFSRGERRVPKWLLIALLLVASASCVMLARTANLGGQITHPEIR